MRSRNASPYLRIGVLRETLSTYWVRIQEEFLPWLDDTMGAPLSRHHAQFVSVLGLARIEAFLPSWHGLPGRPPAQRAAPARAFVAKAVFNFPTTRLLIDMLSHDRTLRRLGACPRWAIATGLDPVVDPGGR